MFLTISDKRAQSTEIKEKKIRTEENHSVKFQKQRFLRWMDVFVTVVSLTTVVTGERLGIYLCWVKVQTFLFMRRFIPPFCLTLML